MLRLSILLIASLLTGAAAVSRPAALSAGRTEMVVPPAYFGMHFHRADRGTFWPGKGIGSWRLWDAGTLWIDIELRAGRQDFSRLDRYVSMAALTGTEILLPFGMTPAWASARPDEKGVYRRGDTAEPRSIADWERHVRATATRYKGRIRHYELWNEVNAGTGFFSGTPEAMFKLQKSAYAIVKQVDPAAVFVAPSSVGESAHQLRWFEDYLALGAAKHADVIGYHFYQPRKKPEAILELIQKVRGAMVRQGAGHLPLWNTESGYWMALGQAAKAAAADASWPALDAMTAEAYVARALILGWWGGLDRFYWYAWDNRELGFVNAARKIMPAGRAYLTVARWMTGARLRDCRLDVDIWRCELLRDGRRAWLVWNAGDEARTWQVPKLNATHVESLDGAAHPLDGTGTLLIDGRPRLLKPGPTPFGETGA